MSILNNLYPPIVDTYTPGFRVRWRTYDVKDSEGNIVATNVTGYNGTCKIYFSLSPLNSLDEISSVWVSVVNPITNKSVLVNPTGFVKFSKETGVHEGGQGEDGENIYYVNLSHSKLKNYKWKISMTYKIQIRFCSKENVSNSVSAVVKNSDYFSEWSTATLVKPVNNHTISVNYMGWNEATKDYSFNKYQNTLSGRISYNDSDKYGEFLDSYRIKIYKTNNSYRKTALFHDSGIIDANETEANTFSYKMKEGLAEGKYLFVFSFTSNNLYSCEKEYRVQVIDRSKGKLYAKISAQPDMDMGCIKITIKVPASRLPYIGNFILRRSSSESNFTYWEDLKVFQLNFTESATDASYEWYDFTAESGVFYKYYLTKYYASKECKYSSRTEEPVILQLEDIFLSGQGRVLKVNFNPSINSYQYTLSESSTQTIGGKYPFITRNGNLYYRQIGISGLISFQSERNLKEDDIRKYYGLFTDKTELLNGYEALYDDYNSKNAITDFNDFTLERKFREKVLEFLLDGKVKLFRSASEGAALVRLMNVSVTPNAGLGRMIYNFSATGHEIADCTLENISKYDVSSIGTYQPVITENKTSIFSIVESQSGLADLSLDDDSSKTVKNMLKTLTPTITTDLWKEYFLCGENVTITLFSNEACTTAAPPYQVAQSGEEFIIDSTDGDLSGYILYYQTYDGEGNKTQVQTVFTESNSYTFNQPLVYLGCAVPAGKKIYGKSSGEVQSYLVAIEDKFIVGEDEANVD